MSIDFKNIKKVGINLYKHEDSYFKMFATNITPNGCWLSNASLKEVLDVDAYSGNYVYGNKVLQFDTGVVPSSNTFIKF